MPLQRFRTVMALGAAAVGMALYLAITQGWTRVAVRCEGFGCLAAGPVFMLAALTVVGLFALAGAVWGPSPRMRAAVFGAAVAALAMVAVALALLVRNQGRIAEAERAAAQACAQYPALCR